MYATNLDHAAIAVIFAALGVLIACVGPVILSLMTGKADSGHEADPLH